MVAPDVHAVHLVTTWHKLDTSFSYFFQIAHTRLSTCFDVHWTSKTPSSLFAGASMGSVTNSVLEAHQDESAVIVELLFGTSCLCCCFFFILFFLL